MEINKLRRLGADFDDMHRIVRGLKISRGSNILKTIAPLIEAAHELAQGLLARIQALHESEYAAVPGSRTTLQALTSTVHSTTLAASHLSEALISHAQAPAAVSPDTFEVKPASARSTVVASLAKAAAGFEASATGCHDAVTHIIENLRAPTPAASATAQKQTAAPAPKLTAAQHAALQALAQEGGRLSESIRGHKRFVVPRNSDVRITITTFDALEKRGLVHTDRSTPLLRGQNITVTPAGLDVLAAQRPSPAATPVPPPPPRPPRNPRSHPASR